jgi:hypothetical protein
MSIIKNIYHGISRNSIRFKVYYIFRILVGSPKNSWKSSEHYISHNIEILKGYVNYDRFRKFSLRRVSKIHILCDNSSRKPLCYAWLLEIESGSKISEISNLEFPLISDVTGFYIYDIYTLSPYRKKGLMNNLFSRIEDNISSGKTIVVAVNKENIPSIHFFTKRGYKKSQVVKLAIFMRKVFLTSHKGEI